MIEMELRDYFAAKALVGIDFYLYGDGHSRVTLSREGLRRARYDNALLRSTRARNAVLIWAATVAMGIFMGWVAAEGLAR